MVITLLIQPILSKKTNKQKKTKTNKQKQTKTNWKQQPFSNEGNVIVITSDP